MRLIGMIFVSLITVGIIMMGMVPLVEFMDQFVSNAAVLEGTPLEGAHDGLVEVVARWSVLAMIVAPIAAAASYYLRRERVVRR